MKDETSNNPPPANDGNAEMPIGYRCPRCGNEVSLEESDYGDAILCNRCDNGEYTTMEPVFDTHRTSLILMLPAVVPSQSEVDYSKVKQTCLCGVSVNLCDKVIMPDYGKRCPCVVAHYNGR